MELGGRGSRLGSRVSAIEPHNPSRGIDVGVHGTVVALVRYTAKAEARGRQKVMERVIDERA